MKLTALLLSLMASTAFASETGRFQISYDSKKEDTIMIDSASGKIWKRSCSSAFKGSSACFTYAWSEESVFGITPKNIIAERIKGDQAIVDKAN